MANELEQVPDFIKRLAAKTERLFEDARSNGRAMPPTVSIKGSRFTLIFSGDRSPAPNPIQLDFVVVAVKKPMSRSFYAGKFDPTSDNYSPPACYSLDGVTPEDDATEKQNDVCRTCKQAEWGSRVDERGQETTACRQHKQLVIKIAGVEGIWLLNVPIGSVKKQWEVYATEVEAAGKEEKAKYGYATLTLATCITRCTFDDKMPNTLNFKAAGYIGNQKLFSQWDVEELEKVLDSPEISLTLWGPKGVEREKQYLEASPARAALPAPGSNVGQGPRHATTLPTSRAVANEAKEKTAKEDAQEVEHAPFVPDDYTPPGEPVKPVHQRIRRAASPPIATKVEADAKTASILADLGLGDLDI